MKRATLLVIVSLVWSALAWADDFPSPTNQITSPVPSARFEIVQSPLAAKWTLRLDRYFGHVWQLVKTNEGDNMWEEMTVYGLSNRQGSAKPHFQLFTSGLAARHTFMINNDTGKTWLLVTENRKAKDGTEYEVNVWQPFAE